MSAAPRVAGDAPTGVARVLGVAPDLAAGARAVDRTRGLNAPLLPVWRDASVTSLDPPPAPTTEGTLGGALVFAGAAVGTYVGHLNPRPVCEPLGLGLLVATGVAGLARDRTASAATSLGLFALGALAGVTLALQHKLTASG